MTHEQSPSTPEQISRARLGEIVLEEVRAGIYPLYTRAMHFWADYLASWNSSPDLARAVARNEQPLLPALERLPNPNKPHVATLLLGRADLETRQFDDGTVAWLGEYDTEQRQWCPWHLAIEEPRITPTIEQADLLLAHAKELQNYYQWTKG